MSTKTRNLENIDGANVGNPDMNAFDANGLVSYANDAAFEAALDPFEGAVYWNTTENCVRQFNGAYPSPGVWQYDKTIYSPQTNSTTTGSAQDITPNSADQIIRLTHGSLISIRGIIPTVQKVISIVNAQASQAITILNEDLTATAANRILTGTGMDFNLAASQTIHLLYDTVSSRWRFSAVPAGAGSQLTDWSNLINNLSISASVSANALTIALKTKSGVDATAPNPILIGFRNSTLTDGTYNIRSLSAAHSMVISSGSTLGQVSAIAYPVYVYAIDNAGSIELAVSTTLFDTGGVMTTVAEGGAGAADSIGVIYSTTARTNVPIRLIGKIISTQATAGTWATTPSTVTSTMLDSPASTLAGSTSGAAIAAGYVGEEQINVRARGTPLSMTTTVADNTCQLTLGPGVWELSGSVGSNGTATSVTSIALSYNTTTATQATVDGYSSITNVPVLTAYATADLTFSLIPKRFTLSASTTVYLVSTITFTGGTSRTFGALRAVRIA